MAIHPRVPDCLANRFAQREVLVSSLHADVLRATDRSTGHDVAITYMHDADPWARARIAQGMERCTQLDHSTIPRLIEAGVDAPTPYLITSLMPDARRRGGPLAVRTVRTMAIDLLSLLHLLEARNFEHPCLNFDHVLVAPDGTVQVRGLGGIVDALPGGASRMRFDVGCLLHRALTGDHVPVATLADPHASVARAIERRVPAALALDPILVGVIDALAQPEPDQRPDPLDLLEVLGLSASSLGGIGHDPDRSFRRMRFLFGFVIG